MNKNALLLPLVVLPALLLLGPQAVKANDSDGLQQQAEILFVRRVAPLLREKCLGCHGRDPEEIEGSLDLRAPEGLTAGGDSGEPSVVAGQPEASPLYLAARRDHDTWSAMPPKEAERLSEEQLAWLRDWIAAGANWPDVQRQQELSSQFADTWSAEDGTTVPTSGGLSPAWTHRKYDPDGLWAYQPLQRVEVDPLAAGNEIDQLLAEQMPAGLTLAPSASRRTLIRRASFDLTGLPPTPDEVSVFVNDPRPDNEAFADVIERLLDSPHYGERMAQHWLDVVRYADSSGFANDYERGNAWRYRDYVIRAFNDDKPYDEFIREQIAGDEMAALLKTPDNDYLASRDRISELLIATGFLRMGPWELTGMEVAKIARQRFLDDVTNSVGETFLGHSLQCARCHDHKFDPVPTRDYYAIQAVFATTQLAERRARFLERENTAGFGEQTYLDRRKEFYQESARQLDQILLKNAQQWLADRGISSGAWDAAVSQASQQGKSGGVFNAARSRLTQQKVPADQFPPKNVGFTPEQFGLERVVRKGLERLQWEFDRYRPFALAVYDGRTVDRLRVNAPLRVPQDRLTNGQLERTCILGGGDPFSPTEPVQPGTLSVLDDQLRAELPATVEGRRLAFADWVADARNPLTTRVIVNRIWMWHFGEAIAGNPNNFGSTGKRPTHPRLLDWLARSFLNDGWSLKAMHRRIMMSAAYARSSRHPDPERLRSLDPLGASYAVFKPRRLTGEELRDAMLAVSGELNRELGGIPCRPIINQEVALQPRMVMGTFAAAWTPHPQPAERNRRSIYVRRLRGLIAPMLEVFNAPAPDFSCERRSSSTVTPQVFALFNGEASHARALALAHGILHEVPDDRTAIEICFRRLLGRVPSEEERDACLAHWGGIEAILPESAPQRALPPHSVVREAVEENTGERFSFTERLYSNEDFVPDLQPHDVSRRVRAFADLCLVMLNSNEFVYVY